MTAPAERRPSTAVSAGLFVLLMALMAWIRLGIFPDRLISLSYGLPLLVCLWHRDLRLLWAMVAASTCMSAYKAFVLLPDEGLPFGQAVHWQFQMANMAVIAAAVHAAIVVLRRLKERNAALRAANEELAAREEEISRQNEELQQQNEEIQRQSEEVDQQAEEVQSQAEELQAVNAELGHRQRMLQALLESFRGGEADGPLLDGVCRTVLDLFAGAAAAAAVVERRGESLVRLAQAGGAEPAERPLAGSFARVVLEHGKTAFVDDLSKRPDLGGLSGPGGPFGSVLASPVRPAGVLEVYAAAPRTWTTEHFRLVEWAAAQVSLLLQVRRLHEALSASNADLERQVRHRTAQLQEMVDELQHFSYTITHDMRAPLRAMQGFAAVLSDGLDGQLDAENRDYLDRIRTAAERMDRLITDALSYANTVRTEMPATAVDPARLLRGMIESYPAFQPPKARIEIEGELPPVLANEAGLTQCFSNLLGNAVKFVEPGRVPHVRIRAERRGERLRLWFEDNGIGIPSEMLPRIFGMFQRASKAYEGTGIGLALVRKVADRMGGSVGVEPSPGGGSRFWLDLRPAN